MGCPSEVEIGDNLVFSVCTHDPDTGVLTDADGAPAYRIYEDETDPPILTGTMAKLDDDDTTGFYTELIACTSGNGFENGKSYNIYIVATVDGDQGGVSFGFKAYDQRKSNVKQVSDDSTAADDLELLVENAKGTDHKVLLSTDAQDLSGTLDINTKTITAGIIANATFNADVGSTVYASNIVALAVRKVLDELNLDHLMKTAVGNNADMTTEVTDGTVLSNIMTKGSDTSDFTVGDDALEAIRDAIVDANPQNHAATANNETTGTLDSGTFADTATDNGVYYQTSPAGAAVGGFGLNVDLTFNIGVGRVPSAVVTNGKFTAGALRTVQVWAYDYNMATYVQLSNSATDFGHSANDSTQQHAMTTDMVQTSDGEISIRYTSTSTTTGDDWFCDYVNISSVAQEAAGLTAQAISEAVWEHPNTGHDEETMGHNQERMFIVHGDISGVTDATTFTIDTGSTQDDAYEGNLVLVQDATDGHYELRRIVTYTGATKTLILDRTLTFTPTTDDHAHIAAMGYADVNVTHVGAVAQTANDNGADINTLVTNIGTPANIDSGGATLADNLKKIADDNSGATFDATTDSLTSIRDNELTTIAADVVNIDGIVPAAAGDAMTLSSGAITAAVIATDAIDADAIATDAVTEIQSGLATATNVTTAHSTTDGKVDATQTDLDTLTDVTALPGQGAPTLTPTLVEAIMYLYKQYRNKETQTATEHKLYADDGTTVDQKSTVSDDATTFTKGEVGTGA